MRTLAETLRKSEDVTSVKIKVPRINILRVALMRRVVRHFIDASIHINVLLHPY